MKKEELQSQYEKAVNDYIDAFCEQTSTRSEHWVEVGHLAFIADLYINFEDIKYFVDNNLDFDDLEKWYHLPKHNLLHKNFKNYIKAKKMELFKENKSNSNHWKLD